MLRELEPQHEVEEFDCVMKCKWTTVVQVWGRVHVQYRKIVKAAFTVRAVDALEPMLREYAKKIIDRVAPRDVARFDVEPAPGPIRP